MSNAFLFSLLMVCFFTQTICLGQESSDSLSKSYSIEEVVVIGKERSFLELSKNIDTKQTDLYGTVDLTEVLKKISGLEIKDYGGVGGLKTVSARSLGSQHTGVSFGAIPLSDCQNGQIDLGKFSLDAFDNVRLNVGGNESIFKTAKYYASSAMLELEPYTPLYDSLSYNIFANIKGGSFGLFNPYLRFDKKVSDNFNFVLSANYLHSDGQYPYILKNGNLSEKKYRKNSETNYFTCQTDFNVRLSSSSFWNTNMYYYYSDRELPGSVILYYDNNKEKLKDMNYFIQSMFKKYYDKFQIMINAKFNWAANLYYDEKTIYPSGKINDNYFQREYYVSYSMLYNVNNKFSLSNATDYCFNNFNSKISSCVYPRRHSILDAFSLRYVLKKLDIKSTLLFSEYVNDVKIGESPDNYFNVTPSVFLSYQPFKNNFYLKIGYKDAFRMPNFNELYFDRVAVKSLEPEKTRQLTCGGLYHQKKGIIDFDVNAEYYHNWVKNKIVSIPRMFVWSVMNMGKVEIDGVDLSINSTFNIKKNIKIKSLCSYTFQSAKSYVDGTSYYGDQLPYIPVNSASGCIAFENRFLNLSYQINAVGRRFSSPENNKQNEIEAYSEHSFSLYKNFSLNNNKFSIRGDVLNFTNKQYEIIKYYPMQGRSYKICLTLNV